MRKSILFSNLFDLFYFIFWLKVITTTRFEPFMNHSWILTYTQCAAKLRFSFWRTLWEITQLNCTLSVFYRCGLRHEIAKNEPWTHNLWAIRESFLFQTQALKWLQKSGKLKIEFLETRWIQRGLQNSLRNGNRRHCDVTKEFVFS